VLVESLTIVYRHQDREFRVFESPPDDRGAARVRRCWRGSRPTGISRADLWRRSATYVFKIMRGAKPTELPVEQPVKFEMVINLKVARALGLEVPPTILGPCRRGESSSLQFRRLLL